MITDSERKNALFALGLFVLLPPLVSLIGYYVWKPFGGTFINACYYTGVVSLLVASLALYREHIRHSQQAPFFLMLSFAFVTIYNPLEALIGQQAWMYSEPFRGLYQLILRSLAALVWYQIIELIFWPDLRPVIYRDPQTTTPAYRPFAYFALIPPILGLALWLIVSREPGRSNYIHPLLLVCLASGIVFLFRKRIHKSNMSPLFIVVSFTLLFSYFSSAVGLLEKAMFSEKQWMGLLKSSPDLYRLLRTLLWLVRSVIAGLATYLLLQTIFSSTLFSAMQRKSAS